MIGVLEGGNLKDNLGVRYYLHIFHILLKVLDVILKITESIMCYLGVIEDFFVLGV